MRSSLFLFICLQAMVAFAQEIHTGTVTGGNNNSPLPFANIVTNTGTGTITDADGNFTLEKNAALTHFTVSYIGYKSIKVSIDKSTRFYSIHLEKDIQQLQEVTLTATDLRAIAVIKNAINKREENNPEEKLKSFRFNAYTKLLVTADPDSINADIDSVFIRRNGKLKLSSVDSTNYELKNTLLRSHLYMSEKVSEYVFTDQKGRRENVLASRMAGFKEPVYELLTLQVQSFSFYNNTYTLLATDFNAPLARNALNTFNYRILDTVETQGREGYMIYYFPKKRKPSAILEGVLYIDAQTGAIQKAIAQLKGLVDIKAEQTFTYFPNENIWFPTQRTIKIQKGNGKKSPPLFGGTVILNGDDDDENSRIVHSNPQNSTDEIGLSIVESNFDIALNTPVKIRGRGLSMEIDEKVSSQNEAFWSTYRPMTLTTREKETYRYVDSLTEAIDVEDKLGFVRKLFQGYLYTGPVDFDLRYLIKYNNFEGFKPGVGVVTNDNFSSIYRLSAYGIYGFKDKDFKYGLGAAARLNRYYNSWLGFMYTDDLMETGSAPFITDGRAFYVFEPRLFNILLFHKHKTLSAYLEHDLTAKFKTRLQFNKSDVNPTFDYRFFNNNRFYENFKTSTAQLAFEWTPNNEYMLAKEGKQTIKKASPQFSFQVTKGFENIMDADFDFWKFTFRGSYEITPVNRGVTSFLLRAGIGFGDLPITELFHTSPNNPVNNAILRRFSVADRNSFETMFFNEFFSDRYLSLQVRHTFKRWDIGPGFKPEVVLVSRFAIGNITNPDRHLDFTFNSLEKGYYESGIELNRLFKGFGISTFYRYGPYRLQGFDNNFSFKFTFNFSLGF